MISLERKAARLAALHGIPLDEARETLRSAHEQGRFLDRREQANADEEDAEDEQP